MEAALAPARARTYVVGASVAGPGHVRRGVACQDRFAAEVLDDATVLLAVSDGLGVAAHAATGAETAAGAAVNAGRALLAAAPESDPAEVVRQMATCARAAVCSLADMMTVDAADLACTLIAVLAREDSIASAHIGDGALIAEDDTGFVVVSGPPVREYVNEVDPLTSLAWMQHLRVTSAEQRVRSVAALTDGCQHAALTSDGSVGAGFIPAIVDAIRSLDIGDDAVRALLSGPKINEHSDDDKTLVVAIL